MTARQKGICDVCGNTEARCFLTRPPFTGLPEMRYLYCNHCECQYVEPRTGLIDDAGEFYDVEYGESGPGELALTLDFRDKSVLRIYRHAYHHQLELIENLTGGPGAILDIGSGTGWFLYAARERGWIVSGVEISPKFNSYARDFMGIQNVFTGELKEAPLQREGFDVVTLKEVIEHVPDPRSLMQQAGCLVKPGGWLVVETPNSNSMHTIVARWLCHLTGNPVFAGKTELYPPIHLWGFSTKCLPLIFSWAGMKLDKWHTVGYGDNPWLFLDPCLYPSFYGTGVRGLARRVGLGLDTVFARWGHGSSLIAFGHKV